MKALPPLGLSGCTNGRQRGSDHPKQSSCGSPGKASILYTYARDKGHLSHQRVRVPEGASEVLECEHPHEVLEEEEDGESGSEGNVPVQISVQLSDQIFLQLSDHIHVKVVVRATYQPEKEKEMYQVKDRASVLPGFSIVMTSRAR